MTQTFFQESTQINDCVDCSDCGEAIKKEQVKNFEDDFYCESCFTAKFVICSDCGNTINKDDSFSYEDNYYCESCYDDKFTSCYECGETITLDDSVSSNNGYTYCQSCYDDKYIRCHDCGEEVQADNSYSDDNYCYCETCYYDRYTSCDRCGESIDRDDIIYDDDDGCYYCSDCCGGNLKNYSYKPNPVFYGKYDIHLGIELEIEGSYKKIADDLDNTHLYYKKDGSLSNGFEIVSHPMTYRYLRQHKIYENTLKTCRDNKYKSYNTDTCGMHIHISRDNFSTLHLYKVLKLVYDNELLFLKLAQRPREQAEQWAKFSVDDDFKYTAKHKYKSNRYEAINLNSGNTIEFRFLKGNLLLNRFYKNIEIILSIIHFCNDTSLLSITKQDYLNYISKNHKKYKNLFSFCKENNLV